MIEIRIMTINDYDSVYKLWIGTPGMGLNDIDDSRDGIERFLNRNPNSCFVAIKDNNVVGVILSGHDGRRGFIYHTVVSIKERKKWIGRALLDAAFSALENEKINKVALVVFSENHIGNKFWEKNGFIVRDDLIYRNKNINKLVRIDT